jgi:hypothetical protein
MGRPAGASGNENLIDNGNLIPDVIGFTNDGIPVLGGKKREAVLDFCKADFSTSSAVWNNDFWHNDDGFLFRILERWVLVYPANKPVETHELSNAAAWRWFELNGIEKPNILVEWHASLPDVTLMVYGIQGYEPPWGPWLRAFILEHFPNESAARAVGLQIALGENRNDVVAFVFDVDVADEWSESEVREKTRQWLASALKNINKKLIDDAKNKRFKSCYQISNKGDKFEISSREIG